MGLGSNRELAENKLILLYMIEKINMPVSNLQITKLILENKFMNYFLLQQFLNELCDTNLITCSANDGKSVYTISQNGKQTLDYFLNLIPPGIRLRIDNSLSDIKKNIRNETQVSADFTPESESQFIVSCRVDEGDSSLIDLKILVGTKNDARMICENWKKHSQEIYAEIIESLIKKREEPM